MSKTEINQLPPATLVSGANDFLALDHSNGDGTFTTKRVAPNQIAGLNPTQTVTSLEIIAKGNVGYNLNTGLIGYMIAPYGGQINAVTLISDKTGSIVINIWKCPASAFDAGVTHPVAADSICAAAIPAITSGVFYMDGNLNGWTKAFSGGDIFAFHVDSASGTISQVTLSLNVTKTSLP